MTVTTETLTTQVYNIVIQATPEAIWEAITRPEFTERYFYGSSITSCPTTTARSAHDGSVRGDEPIHEFEPPRRLVHGWVSCYDPELAAEPESRVTWEVEAYDDGTCLLTVTHDRLEAAPKTSASVSGVGWITVLSGPVDLARHGRAA